MSKVVAFKGARKVAPANILRKVPGRPKNRDVRSREHLLPDEVDALIKAAGRVGRHRLRDRTLILVAYRHGLRVSELISMRWDQFDLKRGQVHINRLRNGSQRRPATTRIAAGLRSADSKAIGCCNIPRTTSTGLSPHWLQR